MEWEFIAPMIVSVVFIVTVGGVAVLRPIAKRVSDLLELYAQDRQSGIESDVHQVRDLLETMDARLQLMEERQDFTERLLEPPARGQGGAAARRDWHELTRRALLMQRFPSGFRRRPRVGHREPLDRTIGPEPSRPGASGADPGHPAGSNRLGSDLPARLR